jgi:small conductance mechanosensitive channel
MRFIPRLALLFALVPACAGAAPPPQTPPQPPAYNIDAAALPIASGIGALSKGLAEAVDAMQVSLRPDPVATWLANFTQAPWKLQALEELALGWGEALLPAFAVDLLLRLGLVRFRRYVAARAGRAEVVVAEDGAEQGLADAEAGETEPHPRRLTSARAWVRQLAYALAGFTLAMLPLAGFAVALALLLSAGLPDSHVGQDAVIEAGNVYLLLRLIWEGLRLLLAPVDPALRLVPLSSARAAGLARRAVVILVTVFVAYVLISSAGLLGLPHEGVSVLARYAALIVHIELALLIWEERHAVASWIAGDGTSRCSGLRRRVGEGWHYVALFYLVALWVAWVIGVHNAEIPLLRVVLVLAAAGLAARLGWVGAAAALDRLLPSEPPKESRHPVLRARLRAYHPVLRAVLRGAIVVLALLVVLQGWGFNAVGWLFTDPISRALLTALLSVGITVGLALAAWEALNHLVEERIRHHADGGHARRASRLRTLMPILRTALGGVIAVVAGFAVLSELGVNTPSLAAGAGVVGIALGFGSQKLVQDVITGLFLLAEDAVQVGDYAALGGLSGTVERLSIRTITLRGVDGSVNIIPFSSVGTVTNMTRDFGMAQLSVRVAYGSDIDRVFALLTGIAQAMRADPAWSAAVRGDLQIFGLDEFGTLGLTVTAQLRTAAGKHWAVKHEFYRRVFIRFAAEGIGIPHDNTTYLAALPLDQHAPAAGAPLGGDDAK